MAFSEANRIATLSAPHAEHQERREGEARDEARDAPPGARPEAVERVDDLGGRRHSEFANNGYFNIIRVPIQ